MRILVVKLSSLGDLLHALPAVHNLKAGFGAQLDWVVTEAYVDLVRHFTDVERVISFPRRDTLARSGPFLRELRQHWYDMVVDLQGLLKSAMVTRLARTHRRIGPSFNREGSRWLYTEIAGVRNKNRHAVEENLDVIDHLGLDRLAPVFPVTFPERLVDGPRPRVAICPSSRWPTKNWPPARFHAVARHLQETHGASIYLIGAKADRALCSVVADGLPNPATNLAGQTTLAEMGGLLQAMDVLVSNDSGPSHIAAAVGTPCVVVFGPTNPERTGPYGDRHRVARTNLPCRPCYRRTCQRADIPCITGIQSYQVCGLVDEILACGCQLQRN
jgi:heptosyltransferase I